MNTKRSISTTECLPEDLSAGIGVVIEAPTSIHGELSRVMNYPDGDQIIFGDSERITVKNVINRIPGCSVPDGDLVDNAQKKREIRESLANHFDGVMLQITDIASSNKEAQQFLEQILCDTSRTETDFLPVIVSHPRYSPEYDRIRQWQRYTAELSKSGTRDGNGEIAISLSFES